jgi:hypothetical protein
MTPEEETILLLKICAVITVCSVVVAVLCAAGVR